MIEWIFRNLSTIIVCVILAVIVALIIFYMVKSRKKGGCSCGSCQNCPMSADCGGENCGKNGRNDK